jgi:hypothetical protein
MFEFCGKGTTIIVIINTRARTYLLINVKVVVHSCNEIVSGLIGWEVDNFTQKGCSKIWQSHTKALPLHRKSIHYMLNLKNKKEHEKVRL